MEMKLRTLEMIYHYQKIGKRTLSLFLACLMIMGLAAPALSVTFAVVTTESAFEDGKLTSELSDFTMTVSYSSEALIPDSAVLVVHDVTEEFSSASALYERYLTVEIQDAEGNPILPAAPVEITLIEDAPFPAGEMELVRIPAATDEENDADKSGEVVAMGAVDGEINTASFEEKKIAAVYGFVVNENAVAQTLTAEESGNYSVLIDCSEDSGIPAGAQAIVSEVSDVEAYLAAAEEMIPAGQRIAYSRFFDIEIQNSDGEAIQPSGDVGVVIDLAREELPEGAQLNVFHYPTVADASSVEDSAEEENAEETEEESRVPFAEPELQRNKLNGLKAEKLQLRAPDANLSSIEENYAEDVELTVEEAVIDELPAIEYVEAGESADGSIEFIANGFSVYGVIYTVDFGYEVDGKEYEYSITGGSGIGFTELLPLLGVADESDVSEFVSYIENVSFSNEELVWINKVNENTTIGDLILNNALSVEYSTELDDEQINEMNEKTVSAGDWVLISLKPFLTEETLTIRMWTGDVFTVLVSDDQIATNVITADGIGFVITVTYGDDAEIPEGAKLEAEEIDPDTEEYQQYVSKTQEAIIAWHEEAIAESEEEGLDETEINEFSYEVESDSNYHSELVEEKTTVDLLSTRYFDIRILYGEELIEPKAPVKVTIEYDDPMDVPEGTDLLSVHFGDDGIDVSKAKLNKTGNSVSFMQDGFSVTGTVVSTGTNSWPASGQEYLLYTIIDNNYYAIRHDGHLIPVQVSGNTLTFPDDDPQYFQSDEYLWTYENRRTNSMGVWRDNNTLYFAVGSMEYALNPVAPGDIPIGNIRNLQRSTSNGTINVSGYYITYSGDADTGYIIKGQGNQGNAIPVYFANNLSVPPHVTLHFVTFNEETGEYDELTGVKYNGVDIPGSIYNVPLNVPGSNETINLVNSFTREGYTLANTHKSTENDLEGQYTVNGNYPHTIIGNELRYNSGNLEYRLFYTNHDMAGSDWFRAGLEPVRDNAHWQYNNTDNPPHDPQNHDTVNDNDSQPYDYYLVYQPLPEIKPNTTIHPTEDETLPEIGKDKTLENNNDGTYTLNLSVTTHAKGVTEKTGINLIIVLDTSSSMRRDVDTQESSGGVNTKISEMQSNSRIIKTRNAIESFLDQLFALNINTPRGQDKSVEVALVDFNQYGYEHTFSRVKQGATQQDDQTVTTYWTDNTSDIITAINNSTCPRGTNWADGFRKAINIKNATTDAFYDDDPTYLLFITDGAPTEYWNQTEGDPANTSATPTNEYPYMVGGEACYLGARDEARDVLYEDLLLYSVFSYGSSNDVRNDYLGQIINYAYNDERAKNSHCSYATDIDALKNYLASFVKTLTKVIAHTGVNYYDGIALDTTSIAISNVKVPVTGSDDTQTNVDTIGSITYSKTGGTGKDYTVTVDGIGTPKFNIDGVEYTGTIVSDYSYDKIVEIDDPDHPGEKILTTEPATMPVYKCTVGSGNSAIDYIMPIARYDINSGNSKQGDLNWDLSPLKYLQEGATYKISFTVWPDQEAYDIIAKLSNGYMIWDTSTQIEHIVYEEDENPDDNVPADVQYKYYTNGVPGFPNIVYRPDTDTYSALTNTGQEVTYYTGKEDPTDPDDEPTYDGPETTKPDDPDPMELLDSNYKVRKQWEAGMNIAQLIKFLYNTSESTPASEDTPANLISLEKTIGFLIKQDGKTYIIQREIEEGGEIKTVEEEVIIGLGWKDGAYNWGDSTLITMPVKNKNGLDVEYSVGTKWDEDFYIAVGLMLSQNEAIARGIDIVHDVKSASNPDAPYIKAKFGSEFYYILEPGHDYTIDEPFVMQQDYHFDFIADTYHPMVVDGLSRDVTFKRDNDGNILVENYVYQIQKMSDVGEGLEMPPLTGRNILRGSLVIHKEVQDYLGNPITGENTCNDTFEFNISFQNTENTFIITPYYDDNNQYQEADHVPWFSVNGGYYCLYYKSGNKFEMAYDNNGKPIYVVSIDNVSEDDIARAHHKLDNTPIGENTPHSHFKYIEGYLYCLDQTGESLYFTEGNNDPGRLPDAIVYDGQLTYSLALDSSGKPITYDMLHEIEVSAETGKVQLFDKEGEAVSVDLNDITWYANRLIEETETVDGKVVHGKTATGSFIITKDDVVEIVNVPAGTEYSVEEVNISNQYEYLFARTGKMEKPDEVPNESYHGYIFSGPPSNNENDIISGEIIPNSVSGIVFVNKQKPSIDVTIVKTDEVGNPLAGAKFDFYTMEEYNKGQDGIPMKTGLVSSEDNSKLGEIYLGKLEVGIYYLVETEAPDGYNTLINPIKITVVSFDTNVPVIDQIPCYISYEDNNGGAVPNPYTNGIECEVERLTGEEEDAVYQYYYTLKVKNTKGYELPSTGGSGTAALTIAGTILAITSGFVISRRRKEDD